MFGKVYDIFDKVLDNLRTRKNSCDNFDCRSWLFGALTLKLHELDFVRPEPNVTSLRLTFEETVELAGTVNTTTHHSRYYERCNLQQLINPELRRLGESIKGLALTDVQMLASIAAFSNSITRSAVNF